VTWPSCGPRFRTASRPSDPSRWPGRLPWSRLKKFQRCEDEASFDTCPVTCNPICKTRCADNDFYTRGYQKGEIFDKPYIYRSCEWIVQKQGNFCAQEDYGPCFACPETCNGECLPSEAPSSVPSYEPSSIPSEATNESRSPLLNRNLLARRNFLATLPPYFRASLLAQLPACFPVQHPPNLRYPFRYLLRLAATNHLRYPATNHLR
jgi:hypothetical protein